MLSAITATFLSPEEARNAVTGLQEGGVPEERISLHEIQRPSGTAVVAVAEGEGIDREWVDSILVLFGGRTAA